jgi:hypothetical protein
VREATTVRREEAMKTIKARTASKTKTEREIRNEQTSTFLAEPGWLLCSLLPLRYEEEKNDRRAIQYEPVIGWELQSWEFLNDDGVWQHFRKVTPLTVGYNDTTVSDNWILRDSRGKFVLIDALPGARCDTEMEALAWLLSIKKQEES